MLRTAALCGRRMRKELRHCTEEEYVKNGGTVWEKNRNRNEVENSVDRTQIDFKPLYDKALAEGVFVRTFALARFETHIIDNDFKQLCALVESISGRKLTAAPDISLS